MLYHFDPLSVKAQGAAGLLSSIPLRTRALRNTLGALPRALVERHERQVGIMAVSLEDGIAQAIGFGGSALAEIKMSMHDADGPVLWGVAVAPFVPDLPLRGAPATLDTSSTTTGIGHWFTRQPTPGFSNRGAAPGEFDKNYYQAVNDPHMTPMFISVRRDPGVPILQWVRGGPAVQVEIEAGPRAVTLNADEDGLYLRAVGPSIEDGSHGAAYTVSLSSVTPWIP